MVNNNPKLQVTNKFNELFGAGAHEIDVSGERVKTRGGSYFLAELAVDGQVIARARERNWRTAYKILRLEVEKLWERGVALV